MFNKRMVLVFVSLGLFSCASQLHRGVIAMKVSENIAHVGLTKSEATTGDHVELYGNKCNRAAKSLGEQNCIKVAKGHGVVTENINDDYVAVKFDSGVSFQEGDFIEKHSH